METIVRWKTRKKGTPKQIGKPFPVPEQGSKRDLPTEMRTVTPPLSRKERLNLRMKRLEERLKLMMEEAEEKLKEEGIITDREREAIAEIEKALETARREGKLYVKEKE